MPQEEGFGNNFSVDIAADMENKGYICTSVSESSSKKLAMRDVTYEVPHDSFCATNLPVYAQEVRFKWGQFEKFSTRYEGASDNSYTLVYGDNGKYAIIDLMSYEKGAKHFINMKARIMK